ncbi:cupin domain-containing protein [Carboxylicivirga sp. RSCT41]|uniref:cupin domain-containing protein n=1 Tax=Carboxylicivirga agarovorans TaxID=3417570 RepID=UPI003D335F23
MHYYNHEKTEVLNTPLAKGYKLATSNNNELVELSLAPNGEVPAHALPIHVTFYLVSGQGTLTVNGNTFTAYKGDVLTVEANQERSWINTGTTDLKLLVIKEVIV